MSPCTGASCEAVPQMTDGTMYGGVRDQVPDVMSSAHAGVGFRFRQVTEVAMDEQIAKALAEILKNKPTHDE